MRVGELALEAGTPEQQREALKQFRREQRLRVAMRAFEELPRDEVTVVRAGLVHHGRDTYRVHRGDVVDVTTKAVIAFFVAADGDVVFLEKARPVGRRLRGRVAP
jgi:hypothetical protein